MAATKDRCQAPSLLPEGGETIERWAPTRPATPPLPSPPIRRRGDPSADRGTANSKIRYTYSEARQKLAAVLDKAQSSGKVLIRRNDGRTYALTPESLSTSPLAVPTHQSQCDDKGTRHHRARGQEESPGQTLVGDVDPLVGSNLKERDQIRLGGGSCPPPSSPAAYPRPPRRTPGGQGYAQRRALIVITETRRPSRAPSSIRAMLGGDEGGCHRVCWLLRFDDLDSSRVLLSLASSFPTDSGTGGRRRPAQGPGTKPCSPWSWPPRGLSRRLSVGPMIERDQPQRVSVPVSGWTDLYLAVTDEGDYHNDCANWRGSSARTGLRRSWTPATRPSRLGGIRASSGGTTRAWCECASTVGQRTFIRGLGTHANSVIHYRLQGNRQASRPGWAWTLSRDRGPDPHFMVGPGRGPSGRGHHLQHRAVDGITQEFQGRYPRSPPGDDLGEGGPHMAGGWHELGELGQRYAKATRGAWSNQAHSPRKEHEASLQALDGVRQVYLRSRKAEEAMSGLRDFNTEALRMAIQDLSTTFAGHYKGGWGFSGTPGPTGGQREVPARAGRPFSNLDQLGMETFCHLRSPLWREPSWPTPSCHRHPETGFRSAPRDQKTSEPSWPAPELAEQFIRQKGFDDSIETLCSGERTRCSSRPGD